MAETPKEKLKKLTAWETSPTLSDGEIDELLDAAGVMDAAGAAPGSEGWLATYDLNAAAAAGWLLKAARASALTEAGAEGSGIVTSKVFDNCRAMARIFAGKGGTAVPLRIPRK